MKSPVLENDLRSIIRNTVRGDVHTHLVPASTGEPPPSSTLESLLSYHYLTVEATAAAGTPVAVGSTHSELEASRIVWDKLFRDRLPTTEAQIGVVTVLDYLGVNWQGREFYSVQRDYNSLHLSDNDFFSSASLSSVVMTINPLDSREYNYLFAVQDDKTWLGSLRLDTVLSKEYGWERLGTIHNVRRDSRPYSILNALVTPGNVSYIAISCSDAELEAYLRRQDFVELLEWCASKNQPLFLMLGVKRSVNPSLGQGGDGLASEARLDALEEILDRFRDLRIYATHLHSSAQQRLCVLARKFPALTLFGTWWFRNRPSEVRSDLELRLDLLGTRFIPQCSDAREAPQLFYKWKRFDDVLTQVLEQRFCALDDIGVDLTEASISLFIEDLLNHETNGVLIR